MRYHPKAWGIGRDVEVIRDIPVLISEPKKYNGLDIYRPKSMTGPLPVLLYIHGGGFRILSKKTHWMMNYLFAQRGFVVFSIDYRLAPKHRFPNGLEDVCAAAAAWIQDHGAEYGADVSRWAVAGESAGGNLSVALTVANCGRRPEAFAQNIFERHLPIKVVLPACGLLHVGEPERFCALKPDMPTLFARRIEQVCHDYVAGYEGDLTLANPLVLLESDWEPERPLPPMVVTVGDKDPIEDDSVRLSRALDRRGVPNELHIYPGGIHAFHAVYWSEIGQKCWADQFAFLDRHLPPSEG